MQYCINCGKALTDEDFEELEGYCPNCILLESKDFVYKLFKFLMQFIIGFTAFIASSIQVTYSFIFVSPSYQLGYMVPVAISFVSSTLICAYCLKRFKQNEIHL